MSSFILKPHSMVRKRLMEKYIGVEILLLLYSL